MRLRPRHQDPWDPPRWERARRFGIVAAVVIGFVVVAVLFVDVVQPFAFDVVGRMVVALGGGDLAARIVVWGLYLAAAASAWAWWRLEQGFGMARTTVVLGILAAPLWLGAVAIMPPSRNEVESARLIGEYVGDARLGAAIHQAFATGIGLVLLVVGIRWLMSRTLLRNRRSRWSSRDSWRPIRHDQGSSRIR